MKPEDYHKERIKLQILQAKLQFAQVVIQVVTLLTTLLILNKKI